MFSQGSVLGTGNGMAAAESWGLLLPLVRLLRLRTMAIHVFGHIKNATSELAITHTHTHIDQYKVECQTEFLPA